MCTDGNMGSNYATFSCCCRPAHSIYSHRIVTYAAAESTGAYSRAKVPPYLGRERFPRGSEHGFCSRRHILLRMSALFSSVNFIR